MNLNLRTPAALLALLPAAAHAHPGDHTGMFARLADHLLQSPDHLLALAIVSGIAVTAVRAVFVWQRRERVSRDRR